MTHTKAELADAFKKLTELTEIESRDDLENAVFEDFIGDEIAVLDVEGSWSDRDLSEKITWGSEAAVRLEGGPLDVGDNVHSFVEFVDLIDRGDYTFVRVEE